MKNVIILGASPNIAKHVSTILRPTWFTDGDEVDYETTRKGELEKGHLRVE